MGAAASALPARELTPERAAKIAAKHGLAPIGVRPRLRDYVRTTWRRREFIRGMASSRAYAENEGTYLGQLWAILTPAMNALVYVMIFGLLLKASRGVENVVSFIVVGTFVYRMFDDGVHVAAKSITNNSGLVRALKFPRAVLPISAVVSKFMAQLPALLVMAVFVVLSRYVPNNVPVPISWKWLLLPVAVALFFVFSLGVGLIFARVCSAFPDLLNFFPFVFRIVMYASGVIFPINHYVQNGAVTGVLEYQPIGLYLDISRQAMMNEPTIPLDLTKWLLALAWAVGMLVVGYVFFWRAEARYGRE